MQEKCVLFFADGSQETGNLLTRILKRQPTVDLLSSFLEGSRHALQAEYSRLSTAHRNTLPNFSDLRCIVQSQTPGRRHTALHSVEVVLVQLAYFIASPLHNTIERTLIVGSAYEQRPQEPYPNAGNSVIVGICYGELAATAVRLARSLQDLVPLAVDAVRLAFRGGVLTAARGQDIEIEEAAAGSWAMTVSRATGLDSAAGLAEFHSQQMISPSKEAWISAFGKTTITIGGPPSTLDHIPDYLARRDAPSVLSTLHRLPINTPCHANHLYSPEETAALLQQPSPLESLLSDQPVPCLGQNVLKDGNAEEPLPTRSRSHLFGEAIYEVLAKPIKWADTVSGCQKILSKDAVTTWRVRSFGPDLVGRRLSSGLQVTGKPVAFDGAFSQLTTTSSLALHAPIAIVGMAGRFPSADSLDEFWDLLRRGTDCCQQIPKDRFDSGTHLKRPAYGCFLKNPGLFDAHFFHMSPREALETDPGHRMALTTTHEALAMAGFVPNRTVSTQLSRVGTFWGQASDEYKEQNASQNIGPYFITGSLRSFGPGRINYHFKFDGPAVSVDTACSSSMVALNQACIAIWNGDCDTAVVGGSNIVTSVNNYKGLNAGRFLSPTGACKTFDEQADGYCRGEAVASIVIKSLQQANADKDNVLGVIRAVSTNHSSNAPSLTRPHGPTQETLFRRVLDQAGLGPSDIDYVEMHGTGTQAGDSVEMNSVVNTFASSIERKTHPLWIGGVKSNVGHGEAASGVTSLIKSLLMLREKEVLPHIGVKSGVVRHEPDLGASHIRIPFNPTEWRLPDYRNNGPRRLLVNNFSAAGGNTALILEEPAGMTMPRDDDPRTHHIVTVSAKTTKSLMDYMHSLLAWIKRQSDLRLSDLAYSATARRTHYFFRSSFVASSLAEIQQCLEQALASPKLDNRQDAGKTVFVFTGYTDLYISHTSELFKTSSLFRSELLRLDQTAQSLGFDTTVSLFTDGEVLIASLTQKQLAHVMAQLSMWRLMQSWGIRPTLVIGHSLGEYAALCASGMLSASDMLYIVGSRARALEKYCILYSCGMLALRASIAEAQDHLESMFDELEVSCVNSPVSTVLTGPCSRLNDAEELLNRKHVQFKRLDSPLAFHSQQMNAVTGELTRLASYIKLADPRVPFLSPLHDQAITKASQLGPDYFKRQTRETVNFCTMLLTASREQLVDSSTVWLELGPHAICTPMIRSTLGSEARIASLIKKNEGTWATASKVVDLLYKAGIDIDWREYHRDFKHQQQLVNLPPYVFDEQNYWKLYQPTKHVQEYLSDGLLATSSNVTRYFSKTLHTLASRTVQDGYLLLVFETNLLDPELHTVIKGHIMNGACLCPASVYADIALTISKYLCESEFKAKKVLGACISNLDIYKPIIVPASGSLSHPKFRIVAHSDIYDGQTRLRFETIASSDGSAIVHAKCEILFEEMQAWQSQWSKDRDMIQREVSCLEAGLLRGLSQKLLHQLIYRVFDDVVRYECRFKSMRELVVDVERLRALTLLDLYQGPECEGYCCCPYWMDGFAHVAGFVLNGLKAQPKGAVYISPGWKRFRILESIDPKKQYRVFVQMDDTESSKVTADCFILDGDKIVGKIDGLKFQLVSKAVLDKILPPDVSPSRLLHSQTEPLTSSSGLPVTSRPEKKPSTASRHLPATSGLERKVIEILSEETGTSPDRIGPDSQLSELGVDSLLSFAILSRMREEFGPDLPPSLFRDQSSVGALQSYIKTTNARSELQYTDVDQSTSDYMPTPTTRSTEPGEAFNQSNSSSSQCLILRRIVAEQLGIEADSLSSTQNLFNLGLDSLMSLEIVDALSDQLGLTLDSTTLLSNNSLDQLEKLFTLSATKRNHVQHKASAQSAQGAQNLSVCLQGDPSKCTKTLFLFPDGSGSASVYIRLPRIDNMTCVYGLNSPHLKSNSQFDLLELVRTWVGEIRVRQPRGPYSFGGWSVGGYYAYEAAKILAEACETVNSLICIDTPPRNVYEAMPEDVLDALAKSGTMGDQGEPAPQWLVDHFLLTIRAVSRYSPTPMASHPQPSTYLIWAADGSSDISQNVSTTPGFSTRVAKFFLSNTEEVLPRGWEGLIAPSNLRMIKTTGTHFNMILPPNAQNLSRAIAAALGGQEDQFRRFVDATQEAATAPQWRPDILSMSMSQLKEYLICKITVPQVSMVYDLLRLSYCYIHQTLDQVSETESKQMAPYLQRFYEWMQHQKRLAMENRLHPQSSEWSSFTKEGIQALENTVSDCGVDGTMLRRVGQNLVPILLQKVAPLELMLRDHLLYHYYAGTFRVSRSFAQIEVLSRLVVSQVPQPNILEIGAGTGSCTAAIMKAITAYERGSNSSLGLKHYTYTDVSPGFFRDARERFRSHASRMSFRRLDIGQDPATQGFEAGQYDLIIACQVLHVASDISRTMAHVQKLLKRGGRLIMMETTRDALDISLIFGVLPGWWPSEDKKRWLTPSLSIEQWSSALRSAGFSDMDIEGEEEEDDRRMGNKGTKIIARESFEESEDKKSRGKQAGRKKGKVEGDNENKEEEVVEKPKIKRLLKRW
ncbi:hypothetical protein MMC30_008394 [Trapelia coarctata]|nr:hypothetical protein [Trapelia coarctata]